MKKILLFLFLLPLFLSAQFSPTGSKTRFVNGISLGTKLDGSLSAQVDSNAIWWRADSSLMGKYKGAAFVISSVSSPSTGKLNISDTSAMLSNRLKISDTASMLSNRLKISDTATMLSNRLKISDTATMLGGYARNGQYLPYTGALSDIDLNSRNITTTGTINANIAIFRDLTSGIMFDHIYNTLGLPKGLIIGIGESSGVLGGIEFRHVDGGFNGSITSVLFKKNASVFYDSVQLNAQTANRVAIIGSLKQIESSATTATELGYVSGVTSAIQTQFGNKLNISDTAAMLANLLRKTDTATMLSNYIVNITGANGISVSGTKTRSLTLGAITPSSVSTSGILTVTTAATIGTYDGGVQIPIQNGYALTVGEGTVGSSKSIYSNGNIFVNGTLTSSTAVINNLASATITGQTADATITSYVAGSDMFVSVNMAGWYTSGTSGSARMRVEYTTPGSDAIIVIGDNFTHSAAGQEASLVRPFYIKSGSTIYVKIQVTSSVGFTYSAIGFIHKIL